MSRSLLLMAVVLLVLVALPALAQVPGAGGDQGGQGRGAGEAMRARMGMMMSAPPVMVVAEGKIYIIFMGQLSVFDANTLECLKTVPLPMPMMPWGRGGQGAPPAGGPPPAPPG